MTSSHDSLQQRKLAVLHESIRRIRSGESHPTVQAIADSLSMTRSEVEAAALALKADGLIKTEGSPMHGVERLHSPSDGAYEIVGPVS